jgi:hypothetical protein
MWVYVDESGNTGNRLFDEDQPLFITAAMMTKTNFDLVWRSSLASIARQVSVEALHANELGVARIEMIADGLLRIVKKADARFFMSRVEKRYLAASKVYDTYFDAGENLAVPWHIYWIRPMRLLMTFKLSKFIVTEEIALTVWECLTTQSEKQSRVLFLQAAETMLRRVSNVPDQRSRQVISEALHWARENPENFSTHLKDKASRYGHSPNFVAFTNLLDGIEKVSKSWKRPVREIVHDRQSQFENTLKQWHKVVSRPELAAAEPTHWPGEDEPLHFGKAAGSQLRMATEETSSGLQVIDVVLWLFKRVLDQKEIGPYSARLLNWSFKRAYQHDFSFSGVGESVERALDRIMNEAQSEEQKMGGAQMLASFEDQREKAMREYSLGKLKEAGSKES